MSWSIVIAALWVLVATGTALLPMRRQYVPGVTLLLVAPVLILWLGYDFGWGWGVAAFIGFASMFRNPLRYLFARARGQRPEIPK
ncbi:DUF2484 family protein [Octadecabacter ascidiaceicola]|uniref:UDP-N-acetylmuramate--alanine ligase n=1 Tax=Octadecabacter ascidiaceicola TaxID=1655543 RepID=A0A238K505_9RHOB|nr:DUF2484 family protein [Octadecabacter ascidiaceicola]SMX37925.1 hypothetical protein OCA8868_01613 [Octadecabacter ascidiaceicola]